jgi:hypothetical protein
MKVKYLFLLLLSGVAFAQNTNISVISAEELNVVYRGIGNPIKIAVPGAKSFIAVAPGLTAVDSLGNYILSPGVDNEVTVKIDAVMEDGFNAKGGKSFSDKRIASCCSCIIWK